MWKFILFFLWASVVCGHQAPACKVLQEELEPGLRGKYGRVSEEAADKDFFFSIPRTVRDAEAKGWKKTVPPPSPLPHLTMYCSEGREVCSLYHPVSKFVAGIQFALPVNATLHPATIAKYYTRWTPPASDTETARDYWAVTQYFLPKDSKQYIPTEKHGGTLQFDAVWVKGPDGNLMEIPMNETKLKAHFIKQSCIPKMGTHYYFNLSRELSCDTVFPWFPLVKEEKLIGLGFSVFGYRTEPLSQYREWYEILDVPVKDFSGLFQVVIPDAPLCYTDLYSQYKYLALHLYFIDKPRKITCSPEDSKFPLPEAILNLI